MCVGPLLVEFTTTMGRGSAPWAGVAGAMGG